MKIEIPTEGAKRLSLVLVGAVLWIPLWILDYQIDMRNHPADSPTATFLVNGLLTLFAAAGFAGILFGLALLVCWVLDGFGYETWFSDWFD